MANIFISGGSSGLGLRLTVDSIKSNDSVYSTYHTRPAALQFLLKRFSNLVPIQMDLNDIHADASWPESIDTGILCAGTIRNQLMLKETSPDFEHHLQTNLTGNMKLCQALYPKLRKSNNPHLVIISSRSAYEGNLGQAAYSASRAALVGFAKTLSREWARAGIKVNIIFPGFMKTRQTIAMPASIQADYEQKNVLGHINTLGEISRFVRFLITTQNISGQVFNLDSRVNTD
jgi:3-oxoacyl-[acyl-carrier protein] reductase